MNPLDRAVRHAQFYFRLIAERAGIKWTGDNDSEIRELIEFIVAAAREPAG